MRNDRSARARGFLLLVATVGIGRTTLAQPIPSDPTLANETFTLKNGLRVVLHVDHSLPKIAVVTWYEVGSKDERKGRTGFAHLFEHLMFKGSAHVPDGKLDRLLESAGGYSNAYTSNDSTVYYNLAASNFLEMMLWLDADRMAGLIETLEQTKLDNQRDVVRNERRQSYENRPYGQAWLTIEKELWPVGHGYHWPVIGYHKDLLAATLGDVSGFFRQYYRPANSVLVVAGDFAPPTARALIEKYFAWIPSPPTTARPTYAEPAPLAVEKRIVLTDNVEVPRVYLVWRGPPHFTQDEAPLAMAAAVLASGKSSRLFKRLVYQDRIAQDVEASFEGQQLGGAFYVVATAKPGVRAEALISAIDAEMAALAKETPTRTEVERVKTVFESATLSDLQSLLSRAVRLAGYTVDKSDPNFLSQDLERYRRVTPADVVRVATKYWLPTRRVVVIVKPGGQKTKDAAHAP